MRGVYNASFVGFFPVEDPQFVILVNIHHPKKSIYGSSAAGPVFKQIVLDLISQHNIPPNNLVAGN